MLNLIFAIFSAAMVSVMMRLSEARVKNNTGMLCVNYLVSFLMAWGGMGFSQPFPSDPGVPLAMLLGVITGVSYLGGFVLLQMNIRENGVVLSSTFMKLSLLVSFVASVVVFRELPGLLQWVGFGLTILAIILINYHPSGEKAGKKWGLLLLILVVGTGEVMNKTLHALGHSALSNHYLLYIFATALILCLVMAAKEKIALPGKNELFFGLLIGVPNFLTTNFVVEALEELEAVIVYPVANVGAILVVTLAGVLLFKERLDKRQWLGMALVVVALTLLNL